MMPPSSVRIIGRFSPVRCQHSNVQIPGQRLPSTTCEQSKQQVLDLMQE